MWTTWTILMFLYHFVYSTSDVSICRNDTDCIHTQICQGSICKKCIKCKLLFRQGGDCESNFNNCGSCLPGYKEISITNFSNIIKPCRPEKPKSERCINDEDCPVGSYCYEKFCTVCFDCALLNKLPPNEGCAKDFNNCGFCIDGFYELPVTTNSNIKLCERKVPELNNTPKLSLSITNILPLCLLIMFAAVVIKLIIKKHKVTNDTKGKSYNQPLSPSAPPLFVLDIPESVPCEKKNEKCSAVEFENELKQQANTARVFKQPHALYYFAEESADDASDHSNDSNEEDAGPPQRSSSESAEACSPSIFIHSYAEMSDPMPPSQEASECVSSVREFDVSVDNINSTSTSESRPEDATETLPRSEDSNSSNS